MTTTRKQEEVLAWWAVALLATILAATTVVVGAASPACLPLTGAAASNALGQPDLVSSGTGTALNQMNNPSSVETDAVSRKIFVTDNNNIRLLRFVLDLFGRKGKRAL